MSGNIESRAERQDLQKPDNGSGQSDLFAATLPSTREEAIEDFGESLGLSYAEYVLADHTTVDEAAEAKRKFLEGVRFRLTGYMSNPGDELRAVTALHDSAIAVSTRILGAKIEIQTAGHGRVDSEV